MTQQNLLQLAKQGNADAIVTLINRHLQAKGITAKAVLKDECLQVMLEAAQPPSQKILVPFLQKGITSLGCEIIRKVKVYGRQSGESFPDWHEEFSLLKAEFTLPELARQKDIQAITKLINEWLKSDSISVKASLKGDCLQVMLEAAQVPNRNTASLVSEQLKELGIPGLTTLRIYGKQAGEDFPDWNQEIGLTVEVSETASGSESSSPDLKAEEDHRIDTVDSITLSNDLYDSLQVIFHEALAFRVEKEDDSRSIHEIVQDFSAGLEYDLTLVIGKVDEQLSDVLGTHCSIKFDLAKLNNSIHSAFSSRLPSFRMAIRQLERVDQEVFRLDLSPRETDGVKEFFKGAASEFSANLVGKTIISEEARMGAAIGTFIAPGLGTVVGGFVGEWFSGNKKQKQIEEVLSKYEKARRAVFDQWELILQDIYEEIRSLLLTLQGIELIPHSLFEQAAEIYNQGNAFFNNQELLKAIEAYDQAIQCNPLFVAAWNNKGFALQSLEQYEEAIAAYDQAISIDANFAMPLFNKGLALGMLERHSEAIEVYRKVVEIVPDDFETWIYMSGSLQELGRYDEMLEACNKAISINPEHYLGWYGRACCLMLTGVADEALDALASAIAIDPESTQKLARTETLFDSVRDSEEFNLLMESAVGVDYSKLKTLLAQRKWKEADHETARLMHLAIKNLFDDNQAPSGLDKSTIAIFPLPDLVTIDRLWVESSNGKYGFSVQKSIYQEFGGTEEFNGSIRDKFGDATAWKVKDSDGYSSWRNADKFEYNFASTPKGHLPSSLWAGDGFFENSRDRLIALFSRLS